MVNQVYSAEFKEEAVRQIVERQYSVKEVSNRLGVSAHSLNKWVKAVKPGHGEQRNEELLDTNEKY
jgi:transposase